MDGLVLGLFSQLVRRGGRVPRPQWPQEGGRYGKWVGLQPLGPRQAGFSPDLVALSILTLGYLLSL